MKRKVNLLNTKKATACGTFLLKILKISSEASADILHNLFSDMLTQQMLLSMNRLSMFDHFVGLALKWLKSVKNLADIAPVFKKKNPLNKTNYRPVSVLLSISKNFEKLMQKQISGYISNYLSPYWCGYRKGFSSQQTLLSLVENCKTFFSKKGFGMATLLNLSKALDTIRHGPPTAILYAYDFNKVSLKLLHSYLSNGWYRTKINKQFSS